MGKAIAEDYGIHVFEALTGFKNICGRIPELEKKGYTYFFGYEESIGCAPGEAVRDKDGVACAMLVAEMAAWCKKQGITVRGYLESLYRKYGYYREIEESIVLKGMEGAARIQRMMAACMPSVTASATSSGPIFSPFSSVSARCARATILEVSVRRS